MFLKLSINFTLLLGLTLVQLLLQLFLELVVLLDLALLLQEHDLVLEADRVPSPTTFVQFRSDRKGLLSLHSELVLVEG